MNNYYLIKFAEEENMVTLPGFEQPVRKEFADRYNKNVKKWDDASDTQKKEWYERHIAKSKQEIQRLKESVSDPDFMGRDFPANNLPGGPMDMHGVGFGSPNFDYSSTYLDYENPKKPSERKNVSDAYERWMRKRTVKSLYPGAVGSTTVSNQQLMMQSLGFKTPKELERYYALVDKNREEMGLRKPSDTPTWENVREDGPIAPKVDVVLTEPSKDLNSQSSYFTTYPDLVNGGRKPSKREDQMLQREVGTTPGSFGLIYTDSLSFPHEAGHANAVVNGNNKLVNIRDNPNFPTTTLMDAPVGSQDYSNISFFGEQPYFSFKGEAAGFEPRMIQYVRRTFNKGYPFKGEGEKVREILNNPLWRFEDDPGLQTDHRRYMDSLQAFPEEEQKKYINEFVKRAPAWAQNKQIPTNTAIA